MARLQYTLQLPAPSAADVVTQELHVSLNGTEQTPQSITVPANTAQFVANDGDAVDCWLIDIDKAGNRSQPGPHLTFTAKDTIAPPPPGAPTVTAEVDLDDTTPAASGTDTVQAGSGTATVQAGSGTDTSPASGGANG